MDMGVMATVNQTIDFDTASLIATEFNYEVERASFEEEVILKVEKDDPDKLTGRPPVVTIMGHVDHGKTSLLDVIRKTKVTEIEAGGITQHIGAYYVSTDKGQIVFLDTPGHEAFTAMRARGAKVTDIVVLVVAADDGVMPQTVEAINHSKAAGVPIIVAINKIDKANADPERVKREIAELGLAPEEWGGDTIFVNVSAKTNQGIEELLEMILLQAELMELKANPDKFAQGNVVEAKIDSGRGAVATLLIREGTLHTGNAIVCGIHHGKVRAMLNDRGKHVEAAGPSIPVEILGLTGVPNAGDEFIALADDKSAKQVSIHRIQKQRSKDLSKTSRLSLEKLFEQMEKGEAKELNLIIKADVHGSIEALRDSLTKLSNNEVNINVIHAATGTIIESDVSLAAVSDAIIIGFNVRPSTKVQAFANEENVDMRFYNIIYNAIKDIKNAIIGMMESTYEERILGRAEVREVFHVPKIGTIAGCYVTDGKIERGQLVRLIRDGVVSYEGKISSLRRFKEDAKEVQSGYECGIGIENFNDIKLGDIIECYYLEEIKPEIEE
jgi:translation initiation factor IF-2